MNKATILIFALSVAGCAAPTGVMEGRLAGAARANTDEMFVLRATTKSPDETVNAIRAYAEARGWNYLGADKVKQGEVTLVKLCIPEVGQMLWPVGLHLSAMLPCGNIGVYRKQDMTEVSLLNPRYMERILPDPAVRKASATAETLLTEMVDAISLR
jgi:hypothetical protein